MMCCCQSSLGPARAAAQPWRIDRRGHPADLRPFRCAGAGRVRKGKSDQPDGHPSRDRRSWSEAQQIAKETAKRGDQPSVAGTMFSSIVRDDAQAHRPTARERRER